MACNDLNYRINGFDLHNPNQGFELKVGTEYAPALNPRLAIIEVPGAHGALPIWNTPLSTITVNLVVRIHGDSSEVLRSRWNTLIGLLGTGTNQPLQLARIRNDHVDVADAQLVTTTAPDFEKPRSWIDCNIVLNILSGRWSSEFIEEQMSVPGPAQESEIALESSMPVSNFMIRVLGPLSTVGIHDNTSDTGIAWGGAVVVPSGQYLIIDMTQMKAWIRSDAQWIASGTDVSATLVHTGLGPLTLVSSVQDVMGDPEKQSSVTITASGHDANTEMHLRGRPATA